MKQQILSGQSEAVKRETLHLFGFGRDDVQVLQLSQLLRNKAYFYGGLGFKRDKTIEMNWKRYSF